MADLGGYDHDQASASTSWTVTHGLNTQDVAVDCIIDNGGNLEKAIPLTQVATSVNVVTVTWSAAQSGKARVVGGGDD